MPSIAALRSITRQATTEFCQAGGGVASRLRNSRHMLQFAATNAAHPARIMRGADAYSSAVTTSRRVFTETRPEDITDAFRHTYASALMTQRVHAGGTPPDTTLRFVRRLGQAHERDSGLTGLAATQATHMDLHNNELGMRIAAAAGPRVTEPQLLRSVLGALADGRALVRRDLGAAYELSGATRASRRDELVTALTVQSRTLLHG
ncbi:MAG: hypothetical protein H7287_03610 [Thermoleophilia bacterium]|nr:hypothetical protein [Thermoleophilia bacterium]